MKSRPAYQPDSQPWAARLAALFNMQPGEVRPVGLITGLYFTLILGFVFLQATAFGLFIAEFGSQRLPYAYLSIAVLTSLVAFIYLKLSNRVNFSRLVTLNLTFLSIMCLLFWAGLGTTVSRWFIFLLPFWFQTQINLLNLVVWPLAGRVFDLRQGKRLFGLVGSGTWLANLLGGFIVAPFATALGARNLLLITAIMTALAIWVLQVVLRSCLPQKPATEPAKTISTSANRPKPAQSKSISFFKDPYIRLIFAYTIIWWVSFYFIDNMFYDRAGAQFADSAQLAGFIGQLLSAMGIVALVTTIVITGRLITRYGLKAGLLAMPLLATVIIAGIAIVGTLDSQNPLLFWLATTAKLVNVALGFTISQSASILLYQPLPGAQRSHVQTVTEGIVQPLSVGLAGLMLLLLNTVLHLGVVVLSYVFLAIAVVWIVVIILLSRQYPKLLSRVLARRQLSSGPTTLMDATSIDVLKENLHSPHPGVVLYAMNHLQEWNIESWKVILAENLPSLLNHPHPQVRQKAIEDIGQIGTPEVLPIIEGALHKETDPEVKAAALSALAALGGPDELTHTAYYVQDPDPVVQRGALTALLQYGGIDGILEAGQVFNQLIQSPDVAQRVQAANVLGEVRSAQFYQPLLVLIKDPQPEVRRAAARAAGRIQNPHLWPAILEACAAPETEHQAEQALVAQGPAVLPLIATALKYFNEGTSGLDGLELQKVQSLVEACGRIGSQAAIDILLTQLDHHNMELRQRVILALNHCGYRATSGDTRLNLLLSEEAHLGAWLVAFQARQDDGAHALLLDAVLAHLLRDVRDRILGILSFQYDSQALQRARTALSDGIAAQVALALEVVENQIPARIKSWVMPLLEQSSLEDKLKRFQSAGIETILPEGDAAMLALLDGNIHLPTDTTKSDPIVFSAWTRASILHLIGLQGLRKCLPSVLASCSSTNLLVSRSAEWAVSRLDENRNKGVIMLSPIEKILILKSASVFSNVPDDALAEVAFHLEEMDVEENEIIFNKGEPGDSMYIVVCGKVRIHDNGRILNELGEGEVFGEMALLDPERRSASVTAIEPTMLLRLEQEPFMELLTQQPEVATGIIRNLARYLRARVQDINQLDARLRQYEQTT